MSYFNDLTSTYILQLTLGEICCYEIDLRGNPEVIWKGNGPIKYIQFIVGWNSIRLQFIFVDIYRVMSFENSFGPDGSININVVPSFGRIVTVGEQDKFSKIGEVEAWRARKGALHQRPADFDPSRYVSFSTKEVVEDPVDQQHIHEYVERSRLSRRLGF